MAFSTPYSSVVAEEKELCTLYGAVAKHLMAVHRKTDEDVAKSSISLYEELSSRAWQRDPHFVSVNFDDITTCCAYLKRYASCHSALARFGTMRFLEAAPALLLLRLFNREHLKVVSLGGGPGNDMIGFCSALASRPVLFKCMSLTVVDCKRGWFEPFISVTDSVSRGSYGMVSHLLTCVQDVTKSFVQSDICHVRSRAEIETADIVLMTKVLSVIPLLQRRQVLQRIFSTMKPGAVFLYIDIDADLVLDVACDFPTYLLMVHPRDTFTLSINSPPEMIRKSSFEVCAIQKRLDAIENPWFKNNYSSHGGLLAQTLIF